LEADQPDQVDTLTKKEFEKSILEDPDLVNENVSEVLNDIFLFMVFHTLFFALFCLQNFFCGITNLQYSFLILVLYYALMVDKQLVILKDERLMRQQGDWRRPYLYLRIVENVLLALTMVLIGIYMSEEGKRIFKIPGFVVLVPPAISVFINLFLVKYIETPCNATYQLTVKIIIVMRILIGFSVVLKAENYV